MKKILMVDDDVDFLQASRELLEQHGYEVITAGNGALGLELARRENPHLVILDVMMQTDTEGFEISRRLHDIPELIGLPIILLTGIRTAMNVSQRIVPDEAWLPVRCVLDKPVDPAILLDEIKQLLR